ncbi:MAG: sulfite exporter TauE/SafE family protein [Acidobacteria bacterium]|nr:sulfite exporter TauE/SafE family protein [Acidobacteriota bacterium]
MDLLEVTAGALTGFIVGMTGVGGGAIMTPLLLMVFGTAPLTAVGTDLWFAAITKVAVSGLHFRQGLIDWLVVRRLWAGSLPAAALTLAWMASRPPDEGTVALVRLAIAGAVCLTAASLLIGGTLRARWPRVPQPPAGLAAAAGIERVATVAAGGVLGALVTMTSVGAGALGAVLLYHLYPARLTPARLVATDIAHAVPLALVAGLGHLAISQVDLGLLRDLLVGSVPAALAGAAVSSHLPHAWLRAALGVVLLAIGLTMLAAAIR